MVTKTITKHHPKLDKSLRKSIVLSFTKIYQSIRGPQGTISRIPKKPVDPRLGTAGLEELGICMTLDAGTTGKQRFLLNTHSQNL